MIKLFGGIFLIAGTCIGGGMLGLPIVTAKSGLLYSSLLFFVCWALMAFTAFLTLEVNVCFPKETHIISMARATLGKFGSFICWTVYLLLLYSLVAVYISGGQDLLKGLLSLIHLHMPVWLAALLFVAFFGAIVVSGVRHVDIFNRYFMAIKLIVLLMLLVFIVPHMSIENFTESSLKDLLPAMTVTMTSFGFAVIVPTLRYYFHDNIPQLRLAILIGSLIPLICYVAWISAIFGLVPFIGELGLGRLVDLPQPLTGLLASIVHYAASPFLILLARVFTAICMLTAFVCVSLALFDYLADGFKLSKDEQQTKTLITLATFAPPLAAAIFYPKAFIAFLSLAGVFCILLMAMLPTLMAWSCRYVKKISAQYQVVGGKSALILTLAVCAVALCIAIYQLF